MRLIRDGDSSVCWDWPCLGAESSTRDVACQGLLLNQQEELVWLPWSLLSSQAAASSPSRGNGSDWSAQPWGWRALLLLWRKEPILWIRSHLYLEFLCWKLVHPVQYLASGSGWPTLDGSEGVCVRQWGYVALGQLHTAILLEGTETIPKLFPLSDYFRTWSLRTESHCNYMN